MQCQQESRDFEEKVLTKSSFFIDLFGFALTLYLKLTVNHSSPDQHILSFLLTG